MLERERREGRGRKAAARWEKLRHRQFANIIRTEVRRRLAADGGTILSNYTTLPRRCPLPAAKLHCRGAVHGPGTVKNRTRRMRIASEQKQLSKGRKRDQTKDSVYEKKKKGKKEGS